MAGADWALPDSPSTPYVDVLAYLKARDVDAFTLAFDTPTNIPTGAIRYVRASNKFQEYDGATWNDKVLALAGGGTGAATASDARTNLGLGTIATQAANSIAITGGTISGLGSLGIAGDITVGGRLIVGDDPVTLTDTDGKIPAISSSYFASLSGANITALAAANITAGGTLPALVGTALTALNGSNIASGTVAADRLGPSPSALKFLRGDNTWQVVNVAPTVYYISGTHNFGSTPTVDVAIGGTVDWTKSYIVPLTIFIQGGTSYSYTFTKVDNTTIRVSQFGNATTTFYACHVVSWG